MTSFDARSGLIVIPAKVYGQEQDVVIRLALDTGATSSVVSTSIVVFLGYDPVSVPDRVEITTGSGVEYCASITLRRIEALDRALDEFSILCHTLPPSAGVDGLLGLDFFRGCYLGIDFRMGEIILE